MSDCCVFRAPGGCRPYILLLLLSRGEFLLRSIFESSCKASLTHAGSVGDKSHRDSLERSLLDRKPVCCTRALPHIPVYPFLYFVQLFLFPSTPTYSQVTQSCFHCTNAQLEMSFSTFNFFTWWLLPDLFSTRHFLFILYLQIDERSYSCFPAIAGYSIQNLHFITAYAAMMYNYHLRNSRGWRANYYWKNFSHPNGGINFVAQIVYFFFEAFRKYLVKVELQPRTVRPGAPAGGGEGGSFPPPRNRKNCCRKMVLFSRAV